MFVLRSLPQRLQASIVAHFEVLWARQKDMDCAEVLRELSVPLRLDIAMHVNLQEQLVCQEAANTGGHESNNGDSADPNPNPSSLIPHPNPSP